MTPPDQVIQGEEELKKIEKLDFYEACTLQLGDKRYCKIDAEDILYPMEVWKSVALNLFGQQVKIIPFLKAKTLHKFIFFTTTYLHQRLYTYNQLTFELRL